MTILEQRQMLMNADSLKILFNYYLDKLNNGQSLDEGEIPMYEYCKKVFIDGQPIIGEMQSNLQGTGGIV